MQTDFHVAVVLDRLGRRLGELKVPTTLKGYRELVRWAEGSASWRALAWRVPVATGPGSPAT